jgi:hypothetical protein
LEVQRSPEFVRFIERRRRLNERLQASVVRVDTWIEAHQTREATINDLMMLEGILQERRDDLAELSKLDDEFMTYLLSLRTNAEGL